MVSFFTVVFVFRCCNKHLRLKKKRKGKKGGSKVKGEGGREEKGRRQKKVILRKELSFWLRYHMIQSLVSWLLLLGTGQEQRIPLYYKCDGKKLLNMFSR